MYQLLVHKPIRYIKHFKFRWNEIVLQFSDHLLHDKLSSLEQDKQDIEDCSKYLKALKKHTQIDEDVSLLNNEELLIFVKVIYAKV